MTWYGSLTYLGCAAIILFRFADESRKRPGAISLQLHPVALDGPREYAMKERTIRSGAPKLGEA